MTKPAAADVATMVADLNRVIHEPARLAILTVLSACESADFIFLRTATGLSAGNLSVQITRLEEAGLVTVAKVIERKRTQTTVRLTAGGKGELAQYWQAMERLRSQVRSGSDQPAQAGRRHGTDAQPEEA
jgi:DNA-binding transcriptional ArsR family regulator